MGPEQPPGLFYLFGTQNFDLRGCRCLDFEAIHPVNPPTDANALAGVTVWIDANPSEPLQAIQADRHREIGAPVLPEIEIGAIAGHFGAEHLPLRNLKGT